jgi:hypothetical protein
MSQKSIVLSLQLLKKNGKLIYKSLADKVKHEELVKNLEEGQVVNIFFDANKDTGTYAQLAKIHASIRELAVETGYSFDEMKIVVKKHAGLCWTDSEGEYCKSFADCSVEELSLAIAAIQELGQHVGINFQQVFPGPH